MVKITFPDGVVKEFESGVTPMDVAKSISEGLARVVIAAKINDVLVDASTTINEDCNLELITSKSEESLDILRHTTAHVFAQAVLRLFPKAKITIGPAIESGFYYDVDLDSLFDSDLPKIEAEMKKIIKENFSISFSYKIKEEALEFFKDNEYKKEIIEAIASGSLNEEEKGEGSLEGDKFKFYKQGQFEDLCVGPHLPSTGLIKAFKLERVTKAYWRAKAENKQLNRIYGTAFWKKSDMDEYFEMLEEAKKRDHRLIGKHLGLFMNHEYAPGMTFFLAKGYTMYRELQNFIRGQYEKYNYKEVMTPNMFNKKLWEISGHWEHYKDDMFILDVEGQDFSLKPMNCPSHCLIFKNEFKSYRDLPLRIADFGALHRNELSGTLSGLTRVRKFCQDDAHIFCAMSDVENEIDKLIEFIDYVYTEVFQMSYTIELSTRPEGSIGSTEVWEKAEAALEAGIKRNNKDFKVCEGDGAFYGPKIDFRIKDCLNRVHQTATIQLDFNLPERFDLKFENEEGKSERPVMIHRAVLGSLERFMGVMIEHFGGKFPLWLSPVQIKLINVADRHKAYCEEVRKKLVDEGFRVETNYEAMTVSNKIRLAREEKVNYMIILGDKDMENQSVSVRSRKFENGKNEEFTVKLNEFLTRIKEERSKKEINY
ncbi:MAG: threonine--tRNA ligase [Nanoarchaeota archaeon]|nr:threonine--tRNA ligase [Nanoarchaeota archaeon]